MPWRQSSTEEGFRPGKVPFRQLRCTAGEGRPALGAGRGWHACLVPSLGSQ